jgi:hypothetical protein
MKTEKGDSSDVSGGNWGQTKSHRGSKSRTLEPGVERSGTPEMRPPWD